MPSRALTKSSLETASAISAAVSLAILLAIWLAIGTTACSQAPQPVSPAQAAAQVTAKAAPPPVPPLPDPPPAVPPAKAQPASAPATATGHVVVIDPGVDENQPRSLVEAAKAERERKAHAPEPTAVITNKSLAHSTGQLTFAQAKPGKADGKTAARASGPVHDEAYWRQRGLDIRVRWRKATDDVGRLEKEAAELRRRFYSQDDPAVRDAQIKPEWDRTLELLDKARLDTLASKAELDAFMEEGRLAGALPGWLREGAEQEPERRAEPASPLEAVDPPVLKEGPP